MGIPFFISLSIYIMNNLDMVVTMPAISHFHVFLDETVQATK